MPHHALINNSEDGDVEVFLGIQYTCPGCSATQIVRDGEEPELHHGTRMFHEHVHEVQWKAWCFAFGSKGYAWNDEPEGPFKSEDEALRAAQAELHDKVNEAALARGFDAGGREVA